MSLQTILCYCWINQLRVQYNTFVFLLYSHYLPFGHMAELQVPFLVVSLRVRECVCVRDDRHLTRAAGWGLILMASTSVKQGQIKTMGFRGCSPGPRHQGASRCRMSSESTAPRITLQKFRVKTNIMHENVRSKKAHAVYKETQILWISYSTWKTPSVKYVNKVSDCRPNTTQI